MRAPRGCFWNCSTACRMEPGRRYYPAPMGRTSSGWRPCRSVWCRPAKRANCAHRLPRPRLCRGLKLRLRYRKV